MTEFELERALDRDELAALFETFASAAAADRPARIDGDDAHLALEFPSRTALAVELERERSDAGDATVELELELEWDEAEDDPSVRVYGSDAEARAETAVDDEAQTTLPDADDGRSGRGAEGTETADAPGGDDEGGAAGSSRRSRFEVYRDRAGEWRWRLVHWNGNVVADSGEGYASRYNAVRALRSVMRIAPEARVDRLEP